SGKTTLIKLLSRLYEPADGAIRLDGVDLRDMSLDQIYARMGVIFQDFVRYQLSVRENIGFGDIAHLSETERILGAVHDAGADSLLADMPEGLETSLGHQFRRGRELSGGEWQKIALARSFMRSAEILILDEPTSALDAQKEFEIFERFRSLTAGRTAILISHRFSTVRMADRIAVLEHGKLVELGSHDELMKLGGKYARLFELQARGYR
ncbi:MAG TPA: ATP-binding cassette domain-containing protein, partial [Leptospiraceae bacterium]|nr:ATP-binding cassette domain-containing protein [Leptospiraceae bacterium]